MNARDMQKRTQQDRSDAMRDRLVGAAIESLVENGYADTTSVAICKRAGVTRGAFQHHFSGVDEVLAAAMAQVYELLLLSWSDEPLPNLATWVDRSWAMVSQPEFKAVIEVWLASANKPELAPVVGREIMRYKTIFSPQDNPDLIKQFGKSKKVVGFYRLAAEAMIGMALGRAVTPGHDELDHEGMVLDQLKSLARSI